MKNEKKKQLIPQLDIRNIFLIEKNEEIKDWELRNIRNVFKLQKKAIKEIILEIFRYKEKIIILRIEKIKIVINQ